MISAQVANTIIFLLSEESSAINGENIVIDDGGVYKMKKVLVTGADGFIGSHLVELLLKKVIKLKHFVFTTL